MRRTLNEAIGRRWALSVAFVFAVLLGSLATGVPALAEETVCAGAIGARTVEDLRVPPGKSCTLTGTTVKGSIRVERGATLRAEGVRVTGNVQAQKHEAVAILNRSRIGGNIQLDDGGAFQVADSAMDNLHVKENSGASLLRANYVEGDIHVIGHFGGVDISANRVDGNLQCKDNEPAPTGGGNIVAGNKQDQCRRL